MPSLDLIAFITGIVLLVLAVLGGGIIMEKVQIPAMTAIGRAGAFFIGCLLLVLGIWLHNNSNPTGQNNVPHNITPIVEPTPKSLPSETKPAEVTYPAPLYEGKRLDVCYLFAQECEQKPAYEWCKHKGHSSFKSFEVENVGERGIETIVMGSGDICKEQFCHAFKFITCI